MEKSARQSISGNILVGGSDSFKNESSKCDESQVNSGDQENLNVHLESVVSIGALPSHDFKNWSPKAMDNPVPISFELDKISHLTRPEWVDNLQLSEDDKELGYLNGSLIASFLEYKYSSYYELLLGKKCPAPLTYCHHHDCPTGTFFVTNGSAIGNYSCARGECNSYNCW